jgi:y4mF family transcriptional regulator
MKDNELYPKGIGLSEFVKAKRREQSWTQVQLADYAGVGLRFIRELEQGKASLRLDKVNQVLDLFSACMGPVPIDRSVYADG